MEMFPIYLSRETNGLPVVVVLYTKSAHNTHEYNCLC